METNRNQQETVRDKSKYQKEIERLMVFMSEKKPYLDDDLTLQKLSLQTDIPKKQLSFLLNRVLGKHFFDYINSYRIEEAIVLLKNERLNIKQVMYGVGFNSKSSFNTAFKKHTAFTPTAYRSNKL
ncbi:MAG: AraC family transcriptional regulator [Bacteroidota bacterium]